MTWLDDAVMMVEQVADEIGVIFQGTSTQEDNRAIARSAIRTTVFVVAKGKTGDE